MRTNLTIAAAALCVLAAGTAHAEDSVNAGDIFATGSKSCPQGSLPADGRILIVQDHKFLYSIIGARFGGNGMTEFALPNLTGENAPAFAPMDQKITWCIWVTGPWPNPY